VRAVFWWIRQGLHPTVALVKRDWWSGRYEPWILSVCSIR